MLAHTHTHTHTPAASSSPLRSLLSQTEELWNFLTNHPEVALTHSVTELEENLLVSEPGTLVPLDCHCCAHSLHLSECTPPSYCSGPLKALPSGWQCPDHGGEAG